MSESKNVAQIQKSLERHRSRFFSTLPKVVQCKSCDKRRPKERFGVRLMNGPAVLAQQAEPIFRIQPYCSTCR